MTSPRQIAIVASYDDLQEAMRRRADELELTRCTIDRLARLQPGYASKLLAPRPMKRLSDETLGFMLPALAMKLVLIEDEEALQQVMARSTPRLLPSVLGTTLHWKMSRRELKRRQRNGGKKRMAKMTPKQRSAHGRKMARARWRKPRIVEITNAERRQPAKPYPANASSPRPVQDRPVATNTAQAGVKRQRARRPRTA